MSDMLRKLWVQFQKRRSFVGYGGLFAVLIFSYALLLDSIPDKIYVEYGEQPTYAFGVPVTQSVVDSAQAFANKQAGNADAIHLTKDSVRQRDNTYQVDCKLFGAIPVKRISVQEVSKRELVPAGTNIGIYVRDDQVMIIGTGEVIDESGVKHEPAKNVVQSGDYILEVDGEAIKSKNQLLKKVSFCEGKKLDFLLLRGHEKIQVSLEPVLSQEGIYQIGIWVRDDLAGVGTLTYVTESMDFGALGHGVTDADVGNLIDMEKGYIYQTTILEIHKGQRGQPGEMSGMINYSDEFKLGNVKENTNVGIYGTLIRMPEELGAVPALPVTYKEGIKKGKAQIISSVEGGRRQYDIEIEQISYHSDGDNKGIQFRVIDQELLKDTGGIVQGMSGSPIVQDGHMIGAVTHVFISDSTQGYGIFIENMLEH